MTTEERWAFLLTATKSVVASWERGKNPSFSQIEKLKAAIDGVEAMAICGHRFVEECDCQEVS